MPANDARVRDAHRSFHDRRVAECAGEMVVWKRGSIGHQHLSDSGRGRDGALELMPAVSVDDGDGLALSVCHWPAIEWIGVVVKLPLICDNAVPRGKIH